MLRSYKYRLYPNVSQAKELAQNFGCCRWVYNWGLAQKIEAWQRDKVSITRYELGAQLPILKKSPETTWLREANAQALQQSLLNLEAAYNRFFKEQSNFPAFKKKSSKQTFHLPQSVTVDWESSRIWLPKLGSIRASLSRKIEKGLIKTTTIIRDSSGKHFASLLVETGDPLPAPNTYSEKTTIGVDVGLKHFATLSTGEKIDNPRFFKKSERKIATENRRLARREKGSANRDKQRIKFARACAKVANQRRDFLHKLSTRLIRENQAVAIEDLNIKGLLRNRRLSKAISDVGWFAFSKMLEYKASWYGKTVLRIGRYEPSSRLCTCGKVNDSLTLSCRQWTCSSCRVTHDRDFLAACNIKSIALHPSIRRDAPEFTPVESR